MQQNKTEKQNQLEIIKYLRENGFKVYKTQGSYTTEPGVPDIFALKKGQFYFFEIKKKGGKASVVQQGQINDLTKHGAIGGIVETLQHVKNIIKGV